MKLSELGQGKRVGKEYNYKGLRLVFVDPLRTQFLEFSSSVMSPLSQLKKAHEAYTEAVKNQEEKKTEDYGPEVFDAMASFAKQAQDATERLLGQLKKILPQSISGWVNLTLEKYEEFFQTEYHDIPDKSQVVEFDPPEAGCDAIYQLAERDDDFRGWLTNTIIAVANEKAQAIQEQKKT